MRIGVYPGTFDPITNGHLDIIRRGSKLVDKLIVAVARNAGKGPLFSLEERVEMVQDEIDSLHKAREAANAHTPGRDIAGGMEVVSFGNLLMHFVEENNASTIIRGLRAVSDFEYEFQMVGMNARLNAEVETVFLMASDSNQFISSRLVKEIAFMNGNIEQFVPERVRLRVLDKFR